jgi:hypothetical protein
LGCVQSTLGRYSQRLSWAWEGSFKKIIATGETSLITPAGQRQTSESDDQCDAHQHEINGGCTFRFGSCGFKLSKASKGPVVAAVTGIGILLENRAARERTQGTPPIGIGMEAAVPIRNGRTIFFGDDPVNVVMAADVVGLADIPETFRKMGFQGMGHQLGIGFCARPATATSAP